jgi:hypothetical protein
MPILHSFGRLVVGTLRVVASSSVSALTTASLSTEVLEGTLLTLEQMTTRLTVLALNASRNPEQSQRVRLLLEDLLADIQDCESELGIYGPLET